MPKILIIEDDPEMMEWLHDHLIDMGKGIETLIAFTAKEGENQIKGNPDVDLVILDGCLDGDRPTGASLIPTIRDYYPHPKPILAISKSETLRKMMVERGCTHECGKFFVPRNVANILKL